MHNICLWNVVKEKYKAVPQNCKSAVLKVNVLSSTGLMVIYIIFNAVHHIQIPLYWGAIGNIKREIFQNSTIVCDVFVLAWLHHIISLQQEPSTPLLLTCILRVGSLFTQTIKSNILYVKQGYFLPVAHLSGFSRDLYVGSEALANICHLAFCHCALLTSMQSVQSLLIHEALALLVTIRIVQELCQFGGI